MSNRTRGTISFSVLSIILLSVLLFLLSPQPLWSQIIRPQLPALSILGYQLVSSTRVNSTVWAYSYTATARASWGDFYGASATVTSLVPTTVVVNGTIHFGNVPMNSTQTSLDTFTLQIDRRYPLQDSDLSWTFNSVNCTPDMCHIFNGTWDPVNGCGFTDVRWNMGLGDPSVPGDQRLVWDHGNAYVDLFEGPGCPTAAGNLLFWEGTWYGGMGIDNDCGPVAGMNLLDWYDQHPTQDNTYPQLANEMKTNNWGSTWDVVEVCGGVCSLNLAIYPACMVACPLVIHELNFYNVGTLPDDLEYGLRKHTPPGYLLYRRRELWDISTFGYLLGQGNPVVVLVSDGSELHWTVITETSADGVCFANWSPCLSYSDFTQQWSLPSLNSVEQAIVHHWGLDPYLEMNYQVTTKLMPGQMLTRGAEQTCSSFPCNQLVSYESTWTLILDDGGNLVLYPYPITGPPWHDTWDSGTANTDAQYAIMQTDGNFVITDVNGSPWWATGTDGNPGAYLALQNDGRLRIWSADNTTVLWEAKLAH